MSEKCVYSEMAGYCIMNDGIESLFVKKNNSQS